MLKSLLVGGLAFAALPGRKRPSGAMCNGVVLGLGARILVHGRHTDFQQHQHQPEYDRRRSSWTDYSHARRERLIVNLFLCCIGSPAFDRGHCLALYGCFHGADRGRQPIADGKWVSAVVQLA